MVLNELVCKQICILYIYLTISFDERIYLDIFDGQNELFKKTAVEEIPNLVQYRFQRGSLACHNNESELIFNSGGLGELHYIL